MLLALAITALQADTSAVAPRAGEVGGPGLAVLAAKAVGCGPGGHDVVDRPVVLVRDGKIESLGPAREVAIPAGYEVVDHGRRWLAPGFVDLHCHIAGGPGGLGDINDAVFLTNPELRAKATVVPRNPLLQRAVAGGVTSVLYIPGSATNMGGQGVLLKTGLAKYEEMVIRDPGSLKLAQAGNPERWTVGVGRSFMNWNTRNTFQRGVRHGRAVAEAEQRGEPAPSSHQWEVFPPLVKKETQISTHTQRYQVVLATLTMVRQELGLDVYIDHGEWYGSKLAAFANELGVDAILGPRAVDLPSPILDTDGKILGIAAEYQRNGHTRIGFNTDSPVLPQEELSVQAAVGVRYGFDDARLDSIRGLTIVPATTAGIAHRVGSLAPGKDADLLVTTGDPVDPRSAVEAVWIEGQRVYDAEADRRLW
ncbi:MAG: amidohydrolase family protein [Planctomycetes bacterium]|nr:amidohydrolase family protein [Planctomycetota bacterium]